LGLVCCFIFSACKKISSYPFNMYGLWVTNEGYCSHYYIEIFRTNKGTYAPYSGDHGCNGKSWSGNVRYTNTHLYIGDTKFHFLQKPETAAGNDSIYWLAAIIPGNYRILATMKLQLGALHHNDVYTFKKISDY